VAGGEDPLLLITDFVASLRPQPPESINDAVAVWHAMLQLLGNNREYRDALARTFLYLFADRNQQSFYTEAGMLPNTGFFSEIRRMIVRKFLPELLDTHDLKDCVHLIFTHSTDQFWMDAIPQEERIAFWEMLSGNEHADEAARHRIIHQLLESAEILAYRIAAMGHEPELFRGKSRLNCSESPFIELAKEMSCFTASYRGSEQYHDEQHLLVLLDQCRSNVVRAHKTAAAQGTSMTLTFLIVRLSQHLERLELIIKLLGVRFSPDTSNELAQRWSIFLSEVLKGERQRNSLRRYFANLLVLLSLRITDNASRVGEHYIARTRSEWLAMWRAAAGGGFLIAFMALLKLLGTSPGNPVFLQGLLNSLIYGWGFVFIHMLHFTVATKQPAMTASTIAATISQSRGRIRDTEQLTTLIVDTARSQFASISGNVLVALPLALAIGTATHIHHNGHILAASKAQTLLQEIDPLQSASLLYAAIAGVWLFIAGLVSGYADNMTAYSAIGERVSKVRWLIMLTGEKGAERVGRYIDQNAGGLAGNFFFGCALGMTPAIGKAFGLPLDIRHIAFSSANLGYAITSLSWDVGYITLLRACFGVALIGAVNLFVSFSLALWIALLSRGIEPRYAFGFLPALWLKIKSQFSRLILPPVSSR